jgi:3-(3-hydroxy-phenyl)propionate hydroxylase
VKDDQDSEAELDADRIRQRVFRFLGEEVDFPILHKSIYRVHQRVADTFRQGRRLLLGDAAHINNPASGMGMNSGILDAACLAEKIAEYLESGQEEALDAYSRQRRDYAVDKIKSYTKQRYQDLSVKDAKERDARNQQYRTISQDPRRARDFLLRAAMLDHRI